MSSPSLELVPLQLTFDDEFDRFLSSPDGSVGWMTEYPYGGEAAFTNLGNHEAEYYSNPSLGIDPFSLVDGVLDITASVAPPGSNPYNLPYASGLITTFKSFAQTYGYFEIRAELPAGQGLWPAFWLLPDSVSYTSELDVFEVLGNATATLYATTHWQLNGIWYAHTETIGVLNTASGFHTYGVDWEPTGITFTQDGAVIGTAATPPTMNKPMYMLVNLAVGAAGSWPGPPAAATVFPATLQVDDVRAYASANTIQVSGTQAIKTASISGQVLLDGAGRDAVTVSLIDAAGHVIATSVTDTDGNFSFPILAAGLYQISYTPPYGMALQAGGPADPASLLTAPISLGDGESFALGAEALQPPSDPAMVVARVLHFGASTDADSGSAAPGVSVSLIDAHGDLAGSAISDANGEVSFAEVAAGTYQVLYVPPAGEAIEAGSAASQTTGLTAPFTVAADQTVTAPTGAIITLASLGGLVQADGTAAPAVTVALLDATGATIASAVTDPSGSFDFTDLLPGLYQVRYTAPDGLVLQAGGEAGAAGLTQAISLSASAVVRLPTEPLLSDPASIQGMVKHFGGVTDPSWGGSDAGVTVSLQDASGRVIASTLSDANGWFMFGDLAAGLYQLQYAPPPGQAIQPGSAVDPGTGLAGPVTVAAGQTLWAPIGAMISPSLASISGQVQLDGLPDPGIVVDLLDSTSALIASATTDGSGSFAFAPLAAGAYQVKYLAPPGAVLQTGSTASLPGGLTPAIALAAGEALSLATENLLSNPGTIDAVARHFGDPADPVWGGGDRGVTVSLLNASGAVLASTVSDGNGWFMFGRIGPGTYQLQYAPPAGQAIRSGGPADPVSGLTASFSVAAGQTVWAPDGWLVTPSVTTPGTGTGTGVAPQPAKIEGDVYHFGGTADPVWGGGDPGVTISLVNAAGSVVASTTSDVNGWFGFNNVAAGTWQFAYTAPLGQAIRAGGAVDPATGLSAAFAVSAGQSLWEPAASMMSAITMTGTDITAGGSNGSYVVTGSASDSTLTLGDGNQVITLTGTANVVTTGDGNDTISLSGSGNSVTVGRGTSTIAAGRGGAVVHAGGGMVSITAGGSGNLFDAGTGIGFLHADGSGGNIYLLNPAGASELTTITGFNPATDTLDLARTLAGTEILPDLSNLASYITARASGADTDLYVDPTGGSGTPGAFGVLIGVHVTVAQLQAEGAFSLA